MYLRDLFLGLVIVVAVSGCKPEGCIGAKLSQACTVPSPCQALHYVCEGGFASIKVVEAADVAQLGQAALASPGDFLLQNDQVSVVVDALDHPHYIAPSGGSLIDLVPKGGNDGLNLMMQATGLLPTEAVRYTQARIIEKDGVKALQLRGHLEGHPKVLIATRYEVRPCEPGVRLRTEATNLTADAQVWALSDGFFWGGRKAALFAPHKGGGFVHPKVDIRHLDKSFRTTPFFVASPTQPDATSYALVRCDTREQSALHTDFVSAAGSPATVVPARDYQVVERFIAAAKEGAVAGAADLALEVREKLFAEPWITVRGKVTADGPGALNNPARVAVLFYEGEPNKVAAQRTPWSQAVPDALGHFQARVPANRPYVIEAQAFGQPVTERALVAGYNDADVGTLLIPPVAGLVLDVTVDGVTDHALVFLHPADSATRDAVSAKLLGNNKECAPLLGAPHGASPACNRILVHGQTTVAVPPGRYDVYATGGPFMSLAHKEVVLEAAIETQVELALVQLPLLPPGVLSADFHVHGAPSYDSALPQLDRARSFLAAHIDVIVATEHDVVFDYSDALAALGAQNKLRLIGGVETTGHVLWDFVPKHTFPNVIGHWNFWPMPYDPLGPYRGAPWDERAEPGTLFTRMVQHGFARDTGVIQLNHPWAPTSVLRDQGYTRALDINTHKPLPKTDDGTGPGLFHKQPKNAAFKNSAYDAQEVMNSSDNADYQGHRALWFYLLNEGVVRAGTANSDSHGLSDSVLGTPRTLVWSATSKQDFDLSRFNHDVRKGHMIGTNGPVIVAELVDGQSRRGPSVEPIRPSGDEHLEILVQAAPWVPVEEVRVVVNGRTVKTLRAELNHPNDVMPPLTQLLAAPPSMVRLRATLALKDLVPEGDSWLVVEAGAALHTNADLDCNGIPDTGDNNHDGTIDWRDVERDGDGEVTAADEDTNHDSKRDSDDVPKRCDETVGPLAKPAAAARGTALYHFEAVTPGSYPLSFTNPFVFDADGNGYEGVH